MPTKVVWVTATIQACILILAMLTFAWRMSSTVATKEDIARVEQRLDRLEDKVEQLNQNYINHLAFHNTK